MMGTHGTKAKEWQAPKRSKKHASQEEAEARAKSIVDQAAVEYGREKQETKTKLKENTKTKSTTRPPVMPKPAWIQYYKSQATDKDSVYGRGFAQTYDYFETDLMGSYIDSRDRFFDSVNKNPEACSLIYPDENGKIRIIHHLTVGVDKMAIVTGVEGLGSTSQVKIINIETFSDKAEIGVIDANGQVPPLDYLINNTKEVFKNRNFDKEGSKIGEFIEKCGTGYMLHPIWLLLIYEGDGKEPQEVAEILIGNLKEAFDEGVDYLHEYKSLGDYHYELYYLLVYLWSCHHNKFSVDYRDLLTTSNSQAFDEIRNTIIKKVLLPVEPKVGHRYKKDRTVSIQDQKHGPT